MQRQGPENPVRRPRIRRNPIEQGGNPLLTKDIGSFSLFELEQLGGEVNEESNRRERALEDRIEALVARPGLKQFTLTAGSFGPHVQVVLGNAGVRSEKEVTCQVRDPLAGAKGEFHFTLQGSTTRNTVEELAVQPFYRTSTGKYFLVDLTVHRQLGVNMLRLWSTSVGVERYFSDSEHKEGREICDAIMGQPWSYKMALIEELVETAETHIPSVAIEEKPIRAERPILSHLNQIVLEDTQRAEKARASEAFKRLQAKFANIDTSNGFSHDALTFGDIVDIVDLYMQAQNAQSPQALQVLDRLAQVNMQKVESWAHRAALGELAILRNTRSIDQLHRNNPLYTIPIDLDNTGDSDLNRYLEFDHLVGFAIVERDKRYAIRLAGNNPSAGYPRTDPVVVAIFQEAGLLLRE